jgi:hypothetical protein
MPETVSILRQSVVRLPIGAGSSKEMISLTYTVGGAAPRIVYIDPDHDSEEERKRAIADDIRAAREQTPQTLELP